MIVCRIRKWNQNARQRKSSELCKTRRAGACHEKIGGAVTFLHSMMKSRDVGRNFFAAIIIGDEPLVACAGKMDHLQRHALQKRQCFDNGLVDSAASLASAHYQQRWQISPQS